MSEIISYMVGIVGIVLTLLSLGYAVYENKQRKKLNEYIRGNNWYFFQRTGHLMGTVQLVKRLYYDRYKDNPDYKILDNLSMADACGQEVFLGVIKQIQLGEPSFTSVDFDRWKEEGKLRDDQVILFRQLSPDLKLKNP